MKSLRYGLRIVLIGALAYVCWMAAVAWTGLLSDVPSPAPDTLQPATPAPSMHAFAALPPDGPWVFHGLPWQMQHGVCLPSDVKRRLEEPPVSLETAAAATPQEATILDFVHSLKPRQQQVGSTTLYQVEQKAFQAAVFTYKAQGKERLRLGRLAWPAGPQRWEMLELQPVPIAGPATSTPPLLPLPATAQRLATRLGTGGQVWAEVVVSSGSLSSLIQYWQERQWSCRMTSQEAEGVASLTCSRNKLSVAVWVGPRTQGQQLPLFLLRTP